MLEHESRERVQLSLCPFSIFRSYVEGIAMVPFEFGLSSSQNRRRDMESKPNDDSLSVMFGSPPVFG